MKLIQHIDRQDKTMAFLAVLSAVIMGVPFIVPHTGALALLGLVPLLCMERIGTLAGKKRMWLWHYTAFVLWNAMTTFWVCNATVGGGVFAILANALQMSVVFGLFRWSRRVLKGALPYIFLALLWIAWERYYLTSAQISWPWLVLGNALARTVSLAQWYEYLGVLGGSLWIWACNLGVFGLMVSLSDGSWSRWGGKARFAALAGCAGVFLIPAAISAAMYVSYGEDTSPQLDVIVLQPDIDPYSKFEALSQSQQNAILAGQLEDALSMRGSDTARMVLAVAPETFTGDIVTGHLEDSPTWRRFRSLLAGYPGVNLLYGASSMTYIRSGARPSPTARHLRDDLWLETHNSALVMDGTGQGEIYHKSKLVVGVEMMPYPSVLRSVDDLLGGVMGRCVGQEEVSLLGCVARDSSGRVIRSVPVGCAICYESVYPEHCAEYVRKGAELLAVITNDAWWGDTPGYRQHLSYSSLRAIETRRDIVRSANTGISAVINRRGDVVERTQWWEPAVICSKAHLGGDVTFFVRQGDITGRLCVFLAVLLFLSATVRSIIARDRRKG